MTTTVTLTAGSSRKIASALKLPKPHACHPLFLKATGRATVRATGRAIGTVTFSSKEILNSITAHSQNFGSKLTVVRNLVMCLVSRSKDSLRALTAIRFCTTKTTTRNMSQTLTKDADGVKAIPHTRRERLLQRSWHHSMALLWKLFRFIVTVQARPLCLKHQYVLHFPLLAHTKSHQCGSTYVLCLPRAVWQSLSLRMSEKLLHNITNLTKLHNTFLLFGILFHDFEFV